MELPGALAARIPRARTEPARRAVREAAETVVSLLNPMAPHLAEELWERLGNSAMLADAPWPVWDEELLREDEVLIILQINGKLRGRLETAAGADREQLIERARQNPGIRRHLEGLTVSKVITVPDRLVNFVAR